MFHEFLIAQFTISCGRPEKRYKTLCSPYNSIQAIAMTKSPEEGRIWEWRAFGRIDDELANKVRAYPIRLGIKDVQWEDLYLVSPKNDQNIKLRRYAGSWVLKFKLLFETRPGSFELYVESAEFTYRFPAQLATLRDAARLLEVTLPEPTRSESFTDDEFIHALVESSPAVVETRVLKQRSQFQFNGGWLELADVTVGSHRVQSISIHSPEIDVVKSMLNELQPGDELEPMNYIAACRRWG